MNAKIKKLETEIGKTKTQIGKLQARLDEMEATKTELENIEIVTLFRSLEMPLDDLAEFLREFKDDAPPEPKQQWSTEEVADEEQNI